MLNITFDRKKLDAAILKFSADMRRAMKESGALIRLQQEEKMTQQAIDHCRPYHHEHAQAGAPICLRNGDQVTILHVAKDKLIGMYDNGKGSFNAGEWTLKGAGINELHAKLMNIVMLPLGMLEGQPVFYRDEIQCAGGGICEAPLDIDFSVGHGWRWPQPTLAYPVTKLDDDELVHAACQADGIGTSANEYRAVANAAIARAIQDGQVLHADFALHDGHDPAEKAYWQFDARKKGDGEWKHAPQSERDAFKSEFHIAVQKAIAHALNRQYLVKPAMLDQVAEAVRKAFDDHVKSYSYGAANYCIEKVDLAAIIARVKDGTQ